ncbi:hypothetical protein [Agrobacterium deltaense]|uniref:hypothetical protein n=1 Tax=Agrobacterium deltaense TaxID=1183412 RepID=UPI001C6E0F8A|nr:hypothetical protein [Agrobacterium deltaense]MBW9075790.1 hypothetical protein [Agrobacterium deltaense]
MEVSDAMMFGAAEIAGSYFQKAVHRAKREVQRRQGYVWQALKKIADRNNVDLTKPCHAAGYEVDGFLKNAHSGFLIEIKTTTAAADIYEGVGQLHLYGHLIKGVKAATKVLLLPKAPRPEIMQAVLATGIALLFYEFGHDDNGLTVRFNQETREFFGLDVA